MSLRDTLRQAARTAITAIDDVAASITYVQVTPGVYDPTTDVVATTTTSHSNVACALVRLSEDDLDWWPANTKGQKVLIPYLNLSIVPSDDDYVVIDGDTWQIHKIKTLPGAPLHVIYVREP